MSDRLLSYGYFDGPGDTPAFDPGASANCAVCDLPLTRPMKCVSVLVFDDAQARANGEIIAVQRPAETVCWFFRLHEVCAADGEKVAQAEHFIIDHEARVLAAIQARQQEVRHD